MSFPTRSTLSFGAGCILLTGAVLYAQSSGRATEAEAPQLDASALTASSTLAGVSAQPRTLASMAIRLAPVVAVLTGVLNQYQKSGNRDGEANTLCALGNSYNSLGQQQKAIDAFQRALAIYRAAGNKASEANTLSRLGDVYRGWGFPDLALHFYRDALQLHAQVNDQPGKAVLLNNLGVTYLSLSNKKKALDFLNQARTAYDQAGDRHAAVLTLINIGAGENFLARDHQRAISLFQEAIAELAPFNDRANQADAYELLGVVWAGLRRQETAETNFRRALELYRELGDTHGEASVLHRLNNLGEFHDLASER